MYAITNEKQFPQAVYDCIKDQDFSDKTFTFYKGYGDGLGLHIPYNHIYTQIISIDDHKSHISAIKKRMDTYDKIRNFSPENKVYFEMFKDFITQDTQKENSHLVRAHNNIIFWAEDKKKFKQVSEAINTAFKELDLEAFYPPHGNTFRNLYHNSFVAFASNLSSEDDYYISDLATPITLFSNVSNYQDDKAGVLLNDRVTNLPIYKDTWGDIVKRMPARNFFIVAATGEGKSTLGNHLMRQYKEQGVKQIIIDLGESFKKYALLYPKDTVFVKYEEGKSLGVNPFAIKELTTDRIEVLSRFIFQLYKKGKPVEDGTRVALEKFITLYYEAILEKHSLTSFYDFIKVNQLTLSEQLLKKGVFDFDEFLHITSEFVHDGNYSFLFDVKSENIIQDLEGKSVIVFELENIQKNKILLSLMLLLINDIADKLIWQDRSTKGMILFEEFAKQLKHEEVLQSVEYTYQAARKYESAIGIVIQSINQVPINGTSKSIFDNTHVHYILRNRNGYDDLVKVLNYNEHEHNLLKSIRYDFSGIRPYSEVFVKLGSHANIYRLELPKMVRAAYLTEGDDHKSILDKYNESGSMEEAITEFVNQN